MLEIEKRNLRQECMDDVHRCRGRNEHCNFKCLQSCFVGIWVTLSVFVCLYRYFVSSAIVMMERKGKEGRRAHRYKILTELRGYNI